MKEFKSKWLLPVVLLLGSFLSLPAYAWPEVDHMNMCGAPVKVSRAYTGGFRGWPAHDNYVGYKTRAGYYFRNNCPGTKAPVGKIVKKKSKKVYYKKKLRKTKKVSRIKRSSKAKSFARKVKYDKHADCVRVDGMNRSGPVVRVVRRR